MAIGNSVMSTVYYTLHSLVVVVVVLVVVVVVIKYIY
jgi:hypothetical protein